MKGEELLEHFGEIDPMYIEAADKEPARKRRSWIKWTIAAAALCAAVALGVVLSPPQLEENESLTAEEYFRDNEGTSADDGQGIRSNAAALSEDQMPYAETRSFNEQRDALVEEGVLPELADHADFYGEGYYNEDGSLYGVRLAFAARGDGTKDYSDLTVLAGPEEMRLPECGVAIDLDENGVQIKERYTETERDGVTITATGRADSEKSLTFEKDGVWYQIIGSWNDSFEDVVDLLDWFWAHPIDLERFAIDRGAEITTSTLAEYPDAFSRRIPDFEALGYVCYDNTVTLSDGTPISFYGMYMTGTTEKAVANGGVTFEEGWLRIQWSVYTEPDAMLADGSLGDISTLTEAQVTHAVEEDPGFVTFTIGEDLVTLISNNATAAWQLVASLQ